MRKQSTMNSRRTSLATLLATSLVAIYSIAWHGSALAEDWPTFRGPQRSGVSPDTGLLKEWPADGPPLVWKAEGSGRGYSSLAIVGNRIYTLGDGIPAAEGATEGNVEDPDEYLLCFNREDGAIVWKTKVGPAWTKGKPNWQSSRSTPTVADGLVCALSAAGELVCCESESGAERWRKNLIKDFEGKKADGWGYSESVLIDGERLVCTPGGAANTMVALNKQTGELIWTTRQADNRGAGHASIVIAEVGGIRVYVQTTGSGVLGVSANDGKLLWNYAIEPTTAVAPTPIVRGDLVFFSAGYKRGGALLRQSSDGEGGVKVEEVYPLQTSLANKHGGVVLVGDYLFGDSDDHGVPFCAKLESGEIVWKERGSGRGSAAIAAADGHLYLHFADGTVSLVKAAPEGYAEVGKFQAPGSGDRPSWAHPVICNGKLYLREQNTILCYDVRESATSATPAAR